MPIYEYLCEKCEREFEASQRITDDPLKTCPHCRSRKVKRLISQTSFVLKGGGWYSEGYASSADKPSSDSDSSDSSDASESTGSEKKTGGDSDKKSSKSKDKPSKGGGKKKGGKAAA